MKESLREYCIRSHMQYLLEEWDTEQNLPLTPDAVSRGSNKKVAWKCANGHTWMSAVKVRAAGANCPFCCGKRVIAGGNSLWALYPELAKQWDTERNGSLRPDEISPGSEKKIWWRCEQGHSWQAMPCSRTLHGNGCPVCTSRKIVAGINDLKTLAPEIAAQWDLKKNAPLRPEQVAQYSNRKVWWLCPKGHSYEMAVSSRTHRGRGCPFCSGKRILPQENSLAALRPDLAAQWDSMKNGQLKPENVSCGFKRKVWWQCKYGHSWQAAVYSRASSHTGCPYCAGRNVLKGFNDLQSRYPQIAATWDTEKNTPLQPDEVTTHSNRRVWWRCSKGHSYRAPIVARTYKQNGCPYCAGRKVLPGFNDLATLRPELAAQWHPTLNENLTPEMVTYGSNRQVWWLGPCGHTWKTSINHRTSKDATGCPVCAGRTRIK